MSKLFQRAPGGNYYVRLYKNGSERWESLGTNSLAEAERKLRRSAYDAAPPERRAAMRPPAVPFKDAWGWYLESPSGKAMKPHSLMQKAVIWRKFVKWFKVGDASDVDKKAAAEFIMDVAKTRSPSTARRYLTNLRSVWKAIDYRLDGRDNPWTHVPTIPSRADQTRQFRAFTAEEVEKIRGALASRRDEWAGMFEIAIHTGLRLKDVTHLRGADAGDGYISIVPAKMERKGRRVLVPLHPVIHPLFHGKEGHLFPLSVKRYDRNYTRLSQEFTKILEMLGIHGSARDKVGFHSTRATFITFMEAAGVRRTLVQAIVGHGSPLMTAHYSHDRAGEGDISRLCYGRKEVATVAP